MYFPPVRLEGPVTTKEELDQVIKDNPEMVLILTDKHTESYISDVAYQSIFRDHFLCLVIDVDVYPGIADHIIKTKIIPTACYFFKGFLLEEHTVSGHDYDAIIEKIELIKSIRLYEAESGDT